MKRLTIILFAVISSLTIVMGQPATIKSAAKSTFKLTSYDADGNVISTSYGVFTSADGEAIGVWSSLSTAATAEVTDINGSKYPVEHIIGANELYDVCHFIVGTKKTTPAKLANKIMPKALNVWLLDNGKKPNIVEFSIERSETFMNKYGYYVFAYNDVNGTAGSPFINENGEVIGLLQQSETSLETHAVDANFANSLKFDVLAINNPLYAKTGIRFQLPEDKKQAMLMVMLSAEQRDSAKYAGYINDYITMFPHEADGYSTSAMRKIGYGDFTGADNDMQTALRLSTDKGEAHSEYARVIYQKLIYDNDSNFTLWNLDKALSEAEEAYKLDPKPVYQHRIAQILFSKKEYSRAYDIFVSLSKSAMNNSEVFFEAAQCKAQLGAPKKEIIELLDSAVARCPKPFTAVSAPYVLTRGQLYDEIGDYRRALADYNTYDTIMVGRANAEFYYTRYKCELNIRQYQQALNDIAHAAVVAQPDMRNIYLAELASLQLRVNQLNEAVHTSDLCLQLAPNNTDALIIKGVALVNLKKKVEGFECFTRAKELGDNRGDEYLKKYK